MASEMVNVVTSEKAKELDWAKSIEICELVAREQGKTKDVIKAVKKRLGNKNPNTQLFAVMLLEMLMNNCGENVHRQVIDNGLLPKLVKIVKKKTDLPVRERIFLLLDATQTSLGGASGKFPQYYAAYYELVSARVQFPQRPRVPSPEPPPLKPDTKSIPLKEPLVQNGGGEKQSSAQIVPDSGIIDKATRVLDVLKEVISALDPKNPEGATDEFILDLIEQCSYHKQRVMHLVMTSRDEKVVTQAIELNEQMQKILVQHDALLSVRVSSTTPFAKDEAEEEEDAECLYRRIRKGKACADDHSDISANTFRSIPDDKMRRPLIRPLCIQPSDPDTKPPPPPVTSLPPPPAKFADREKFFKEKHSDLPSLATHIRGLSLHSRNGSSSTDFSDRDINGFRD